MNCAQPTIKGTIKERRADMLALMEKYLVTPAKAGVQGHTLVVTLDSRFRGNDGC